METEDQPFFEFTSRTLDWKEAFLTIAVRRGHSLLLRAGVPELIALSPKVTAERAMEFLLSLRDLPLKAGGEAEYRSAVGSLLDETFDDLNRTIGTDLTEQLRRWLTRHFVDGDERMRLWLWSVLLPQLAGAYGATPRHPPPLPETARQRFNDIVRACFSREVAKEDDELAAGARREPVSQLEQMVLAVNAPPLIKELEPLLGERLDHQSESADQEMPEFDVIDALIAAARSERVLKVWREIDKEFTPRDRALLVTWARQEGALSKMPIELIATRLKET
jgi:hypothetical protein